MTYAPLDVAPLDVPPTDFPAEICGPWWVLHTMSRQEKALADDLGRCRIACYLPLIRTVRYYGPRKVKREVPMFPGYLFVRATLKQCYLAERTHRVVSTIHVIDQPRLDRELRSIFVASAGESPLRLHPSLGEGQLVEVTSGPFRGARGFVEQRQDGDRLVLEISMLGQAVSVELDDALVEAVD